MPAQCSLLSIQCCCSCGVGHSSGSNLIHGLGTSMWVAKKEKKKRLIICFLIEVLYIWFNVNHLLLCIP